MSQVDADILIAASSVVAALLGLIGVLLGMIHKNAKTAAKQTKNSHDINLRDDLDEKFGGLSELVKGVASDQGGMKEDIRIIRRDQSADRATAAQAVREASEALRIARDIESTHPKHPKQGENQ